MSAWSLFVKLRIKQLLVVPAGAHVSEQRPGKPSAVLSRKILHRRGAGVPKMFCGNVQQYSQGYRMLPLSGGLV